MKTKKQTNKQFWNLCQNFLQQEQRRERLFAGIGIAIAVAAVLFGFESALFDVGIITAVIIYFRLPYANIGIESKTVRLGWAAIMFAAFYLPSVLLTFEEEITIRFPGMFFSLFICTVLYSYIPAISYRLMLNDEQEGYSFGDFGRDSRKTRHNGVFFSFFVYGIILCIWGACEIKQKTDILFSQQPYIPVLKWEKEYQHGNTYYVVDCEKGKFMVSPTSYPEIRDINKNSQIRILAPYSYNGLLQIERLEIKNR